MSKWSQPQEVDKLSTIFGGDMKKILPPLSEIPDEFYHRRTPWNKVFSKWFFSGLPENSEFCVKDGVDGNKALSHLAAILRSFEPKHEHKEGAVSWLMSQWFNDITCEGKSLVTGKPSPSLTPS